MRVVVGDFWGRERKTGEEGKGALVYIPTMAMVLPGPQPRRTRGE